MVWPEKRGRNPRWVLTNIANEAKDQRKKGLPEASFRGRVSDDVTVSVSAGRIIFEKEEYVKQASFLFLSRKVLASQISQDGCRAPP